MSKKYRILAEFIKDVSAETPNVESFIYTRENISTYRLHIDINTNPLKSKMAEVNVSIKFKSSESASGNSIRQIYDIIDGIDQETSKSITKKIKDTKLKVQAKIQGNELRISGQKRDNLQEAISVIKEMKLDLPLQFVNMRD